MLLSNQKITTMATPRQILANRQNARKCRGETTPAGKARSSMNALKTGIDAKSEILPNENPVDRADLTARFHSSLTPATPEECLLINAMIQAEWLRRRYIRMEAAIWNKELDGMELGDMDSPCLGIAFMAASNVLCRLNRRQNAAHRDFRRASNQFHSTRAIATKPLNPKLVSFLISAKPAPKTSSAISQSPPTRRVHTRMRC